MGYELAGHDPYDALRGRRVPRFLRQTSRGRQLVIQLRKRVPLDLSGALGIEKFTMAKTVACYLSGLSRTAEAHGESENLYDSAVSLVAAMHAAEGFLGDGAWGYEFDVQTRWAFYPAGSPNLIATVFAGSSLLEAGLVFGVEEWVEEASRAAQFLVRELYGPVPGVQDAVFRYTRDATALIHNANLLAAGFVAAVGYLARESELLEMSSAAADVSVRFQEPSGRWAYGTAESLGWCDNFHTAYNLVGLLPLHLALGAPSITESLERGVGYWTSSLFEADGAPRYFDSKGRPYDVHSGATAVDVCYRLAQAGFLTEDVARACEVWMRAHLVKPDGTTLYRRGIFTDSRHFIRWGDAHWAAAEGSSALNAAGIRNPVDAAVLARLEEERVG